MSDTPRHPARYTPRIVEIAADVLKRYGAVNVLDPFAGTGERIAALREHGWRHEIWLNEIQAKWAWVAAENADSNTFVRIGDAESLPFRDEVFDAIFTSITYGNRMADKHNARDDSRRNTYTHAYGEPLDEANTGAMQFTGKRKSSLAYATKHKRCYVEMRRVLAPGRIVILNVSDHIRKGRVVRTTLWHVLAMKSLGFEVIEWHRVPTPRNRYGANGDKRVKYENVVVFRKER